LNDYHIDIDISAMKKNRHKVGYPKTNIANLPYRCIWNGMKHATIGERMHQKKSKKKNEKKKLALRTSFAA
jgi:hypothetical protein